MKKYVKMFAMLAVVLALLVSCKGSGDNGTNSNLQYTNYGPFRTVVCDSCEYVIGYRKLAHKGNCRFCAVRRKEEMDSLVNVMKLYWQEYVH